MLTYVTIRLVVFAEVHAMLKPISATHPRYPIFDTRERFDGVPCPEVSSPGRLPYIVIGFIFLILGGLSSFADLFHHHFLFNLVRSHFIIWRESQNDWFDFADPGVLSALIIGYGLLVSSDILHSFPCQLVTHLGICTVVPILRNVVR